MMKERSQARKDYEQDVCSGDRDKDREAGGDRRLNSYAKIRGRSALKALRAYAERVIA
jgi:hypothetical protein